MRTLNPTLMIILTIIMRGGKKDIWVKANSRERSSRAQKHCCFYCNFMCCHQIAIPQTFKHVSSHYVTTKETV